MTSPDTSAVRLTNEQLVWARKPWVCRILGHTSPNGSSGRHTCQRKGCHWAFWWDGREELWYGGELLLKNGGRS